MVGQHGKTASGTQHAAGGLQHFMQGVHFVVHLDAQGLEYLGQVFLFAGRPHERPHHVEQIGHLLQRSFLTAAHQHGSQPATVFQLAVKRKDAAQVGLVVRIDYLSRGQLGLLVHAHVQRCVETERKSAGGIVKMMARHAQVGQNTVYIVYLIIA